MNSAESHIFHRRLNYEYPEIVKGQGVYLYDAAGKRYIDAASGAAVVSLGHCLPELSQGIKDLSEEHTYLHGSQFTSTVMEDYARDLCSLSEGLHQRVFFVGSGSDGVESAVKLARQFHVENGAPQKYRLISRWPSYHGATIGALSLTGKAAARKFYEPYLLPKSHIPAPFCYHCQFGGEPKTCAIDCAKTLRSEIESLGAEQVAAFVYEPIIGASAGAVVPPVRYYRLIEEICRQYNVLTISDEVMCGYGRTGRWFASSHFDCKPDITVVGKGISGGYLPLSAVFSSRLIYETIRNGTGAFNHGFTFENCPFSAGIGALVLSSMKKRRCIEGSREHGLLMRQELERKLSSHQNVGDIRGIGLFQAVEIVKDRETRSPFERRELISEKVVTYGMSLGINLYYANAFMPDGRGDAILLAPPLTIEASQVLESVALVSKAIEDVLEGKKTA